MDFNKLVEKVGCSGSHIPVLEFLFVLRPNARVLEFGVGGHSTPFFQERASELVTVDSEQVWVDKFFDKTKKNSSYIIKPASEMHKVLDEELKGRFFDIILVDGHHTSRVSTAQASFGRSELIVWHDSQGGVYNWNKVDVVDPYYTIPFTFNEAWTSVLTNNLALLDKLNKYDMAIKNYKTAYDELANIVKG